MGFNKLAVVDAVGVLDNQPPMRLPENPVEPAEGHNIRLDQVPEYIAGADTGELVGVSDKDEHGPRWKCAEKPGCQHEVHH